MLIRLPLSMQFYSNYGQNMTKLKMFRKCQKLNCGLWNKLHAYFRPCKNLQRLKKIDKNCQWSLAHKVPMINVDRQTTNQTDCGNLHVYVSHSHAKADTTKVCFYGLCCHSLFSTHS